MDDIEILKEKLTCKDADLLEILLKAKVVCYNLNYKELLKIIDFELKGYPNNCEFLPDYRRNLKRTLYVDAKKSLASFNNELDLDDGIITESVPELVCYTKKKYIRPNADREYHNFEYEIFEIAIISNLITQVRIYLLEKLLEISKSANVANTDYQGVLSQQQENNSIIIVNNTNLVNVEGNITDSNIVESSDNYQ